MAALLATLIVVALAVIPAVKLVSAPPLPIAGLPGETAGEWWGNTHAIEARQAAAYAHGYSPEFDLATYFFHDVPADLSVLDE